MQKARISGAPLISVAIEVERPNTRFSMPSRRDQGIRKDNNHNTHNNKSTSPVTQIQHFGTTGWSAKSALNSSGCDLPFLSARGVGLTGKDFSGRLTIGMIDYRNPHFLHKCKQKHYSQFLHALVLQVSRLGNYGVYDYSRKHYYIFQFI